MQDLVKDVCDLLAVCFQACVVSTWILQFTNAERTYKLATASNISAISCVTTTPHFFSLDRPVTMLDGYQFTLLMYEATGVTTLKSESRIVAEITPSAVVIRRFLLSQLTQPWSNLRNRREIKGWECWHISKSKIARRLFLTKFHQRASWLWKRCVVLTQSDDP